jgi:hypothetical protein
MRSKHDCIVVNPRTGEPVLRVPTLETILEAADWKTDIALKRYAGETLELAKQAAGAGCEMVIGCSLCYKSSTILAIVTGR